MIRRAALALPLALLLAAPAAAAELTIPQARHAIRDVAGRTAEAMTSTAEPGRVVIGHCWRVRRRVVCRTAIYGSTQTMRFRSHARPAPGGRTALVWWTRIRIAAR